MSAMEALRSSIHDSARDIKLNLQSVLMSGGALSDAQRWGVAVASAIAARNPELRDAIVGEAKAVVDNTVIDDALAAAALMAMNNVFYRFRHFMESKPAYGEKPARLRMNRIVNPAGSKVDFELMCLAVSAINGCEMCVQSHEAVVTEGGLTEDHVHEAVRIAATVNAAAVALELGATST